MSRLSKFFDKKLAQAGPPPDPLEMGVAPPRGGGFIDVAAVQEQVSATRRRVNRFLKKYREVK